MAGDIYRRLTVFFFKAVGVSVCECVPTCFCRCRFSHTSESSWLNIHLVYTYCSYMFISVQICIPCNPVPCLMIVIKCPTREGDISLASFLQTVAQCQSPSLPKHAVTVVQFAASLTPSDSSASSSVRIKGKSWPPHPPLFNASTHFKWLLQN